MREDAPSGARADLVREIYLAGITGGGRRLSTDLTTLQEAARAVLDPHAHDYVAGDAGTGASGRANRAAFDRWRLLPRMWRGVGERDLSVDLLGQRVDVPVLLAPVAAQTVAHREGERATARAAAGVGVPFVLSRASCTRTTPARRWRRAPTASWSPTTAAAMLLGRPYVYGLALDGQAGVEHVLRCLLADVDLAMALSGCRSVAEITRDLVVPSGPLP